MPASYDRRHMNPDNLEAMIHQAMGELQGNPGLGDPMKELLRDAAAQSKGNPDLMEELLRDVAAQKPSSASRPNWAWGSTSARGARARTRAPRTRAGSGASAPVAEAASAGTSAATISEGAMSGLGGTAAKAGKWGTAAKWGGRAFNALNAIMIPLMVAQLGLEVHDRMGGDMFGQKKRQRGLAADDLTHFLNSNLEDSANRTHEETVLPALIRSAEPYSDLGQSMGSQELMHGAAAQNYIATKTASLGNMAVPMDNQPTLTEMAARMGLHI